MKKIGFFVAALAITVGVSSCKSNEESQETTAPEPKEEICFYHYEEGSTSFEWTSFKTSARVGVSGTFNEIEITSDESGDDAKKLIESMKFAMKTASVETQNPERNGKIATLFFETINTAVIEGGVKSLGEDGKAVVEVKMNDLSVDVEGEYTLEDGKFTFKSMIDVSDWNGMAGIETLNAECKDLHTGEDGVSKLWSEVELSFTTTLSSDCE